MVGYLLFKELEQTYIIVSIQKTYTIVSITEPRWHVLFPEASLFVISIYVGAHAFAKPK